MRLLSVICLLLVLLNVSVFLWPDKANFAPHAYAEKKDINPNYLRLNKEIEDKFYSRTAAPIKESFAANNTQVAAIIKDANCFRVGPFLHQENYELAQAVLYNADVTYKKAKRERQESNVFRVFLGPFTTPEQATDVRTDLKRKKVLDHFVRKKDDGSYIVSLGIYTSQESVLDAVRLFEESLGEVKYEDELVLLPESYWLYFNLGEQNPIRQQLLQLDWGERAAKMGKFECQL